MIYVTGGRGGHLGREVVRQLTQSGQRVTGDVERVLGRRPASFDRVATDYAHFFGGKR